MNVMQNETWLLTDSKFIIKSIHLQHKWLCICDEKYIHNEKKQNNNNNNNMKIIRMTIADSVLIVIESKWIKRLCQYWYMHLNSLSFLPTAKWHVWNLYNVQSLLPLIKYVFLVAYVFSKQVVCVHLFVFKIRSTMFAVVVFYFRCQNHNSFSLSMNLARMKNIEFRWVKQHQKHFWACNTVSEMFFCLFVGFVTK